VLGMILGPMLESSLRRTLTLYRGDYTVLATRPISGIFIGLSVLLVAWAVYRYFRRKPAGS